MRIVIIVFYFLISSNILIAQSGIAGKIFDGDTGEEFIGANVVVLENGVFVIGASSDFEGNYILRIDPGIYDMEVSYIGYRTKRIEKIIVSPGETTQTNVEFGPEEEGLVLCPTYIPIYMVPLIELDNPTSIKRKGADDIRNTPQKSIPQLAGFSTPGVSILDQ